MPIRYTPTVFTPRCVIVCYNRGSWWTMFCSYSVKSVSIPDSRRVKFFVWRYLLGGTRESDMSFSLFRPGIESDASVKLIRVIPHHTCVRLLCCISPEMSNTSVYKIVSCLWTRAGVKDGRENRHGYVPRTLILGHGTSSAVFYFECWMSRTQPIRLLPFL